MWFFFVWFSFGGVEFFFFLQSKMFIICVQLLANQLIQVCGGYLSLQNQLSSVHLNLFKC